jgi:hypothetical protein
MYMKTFAVVNERVKGFVEEEEGRPGLWGCGFQLEADRFR